MTEVYWSPRIRTPSPHKRKNYLESLVKIRVC